MPGRDNLLTDAVMKSKGNALSQWHWIDMSGMY